jgi:RNA polymerase sigma-B factor
VTYTSGQPAPAAVAGQDEPLDADLVEIVQSSPRYSVARETACAELIRRYDYLVRACARRYFNSPESQDELMQSGYVGLLKAINNFDASLGFDLATYARPCISGEIKRHFRDKRWPVHVRRSAQELRARLIAGGSDLAQRQAREPTDGELSEYLGVSAAEVQDAWRADMALHALSLDAPLAEDSDERELADLLGYEDADLETSLSMDAVWAHMSELPQREQDLLAMRFYGQMTQAEIGARLGMSQMHVSRLLAHALGYLRRRLLADGA